MLHRLVAPALLLTTALGCAGPLPTGALVPLDSETFTETTPDAATLARYREAATYSESVGGRSLLVIQGDEVLFEQTREGLDPTQSTQLYSATKPFSCALVGIGVRDGWLAPEDLVVDIFPDFAGDPSLSIEHLLTFTSGLENDSAVLTTDGLRDEQDVADKAAHALAQTQLHTPGERFSYAPVHQWILSGAVTERSGSSALSVLETEVFAPIGLTHGGWIEDPSGHTALAYGAYMTPRELAKYGVLLRDDGVWDGVRLLPEGWMTRCTTGTSANGAFGYATWLNKPLNGADVSPIRALPEEGPIMLPGGPDDLFAAAGHRDQRMYVVPSLDLVIVRLSDGSWGFSDAELLSRLLDVPLE